MEVCGEATTITERKLYRGIVGRRRYGLRRLQEGTVPVGHDASAPSPLVAPAGA